MADDGDRVGIVGAVVQPSLALLDGQAVRFHDGRDPAAIRFAAQLDEAIV